VQPASARVAVRILLMSRVGLARREVCACEGADACEKARGAGDPSITVQCNGVLLRCMSAAVKPAKGYAWLQQLQPRATPRSQ